MSIRGYLITAIAVFTIGTVFSVAAVAGGPSAKPDRALQHATDGSGYFDPSIVQVAELGPYTFEDGGTLKNLKVSYATHGELNEAEDNVVLVLHGFGSDRWAALNFWGSSVKALDPEKYFIIATDAIGNTGRGDLLSTGPTNSGLKMDFPQYSMRDAAAIEVKLVKEYLGFERIFAVVGVSMGAMKTYQIAVDYPDFAEAIIPIVGAAEINGTTRAFSLNNMDIIALDPDWDYGEYESTPTLGVRAAFASMCTRLYSPDWMSDNIKTRMHYDLYYTLCVDAWVSAGQDARNVYYQFHQLAWFSLADTPGFDGDLDAALRAIKAKALVITSIHDQIYLHHEAAYPAQVIPGAKLVEIDSPAGHMVCCDFDPAATEIMYAEISTFLESLRSP